MPRFEILFEGQFEQCTAEGLQPSESLSGFFALRQIVAEEINVAVERGVSIIMQEIRIENSRLADCLKELTPSEIRIMSDGEVGATRGFTFF